MADENGQLKIGCPGPDAPVGVCVLVGFGSQIINVHYYENSPQAFGTGHAAVVNVYSPDGSVLFTLTSGSGRVTLASANPTVSFRLKDEDFTALSAALGTYAYRVIVTPTGGDPILVLYGDIDYTGSPET